MNIDVLIAFGVFQLTFLLLDLYILSKTGSDITRKGEYIWFRSLIFTHAAYLMLNSVWTLHEYDLIQINRTLMTFICAVSLWTVTNCANSFFLFVVESLKIKNLRTGVGKWVRQIPAMISTFLIVCSPWTGWVFTLDESGHIVHEALYLPMMIIASVYLFFVAGAAANRMFRSHTSFLRKANGSLFVSVVIIFLFIVVDGMLLKASVLPAAIFAVILIIFITLQQANINSDALTGLNNRRRAEEYLSSVLSGASEQEPVYLFMGDLNGFKGINDTYGHVEGDDALIICGHAMRNVIASVDGFSARYGGDEFLMAVRQKKGNETDPEELICRINDELCSLSSDKPYKLVMAVGHVRCADPGVSPSAYLSEADDDLYKKKAEIHKNQR